MDGRSHLSVVLPDSVVPIGDPMVKDRQNSRPITS